MVSWYVFCADCGAEFGYDAPYDFCPYCGGILIVV